jgi:hypothetical protein
VKGPSEAIWAGRPALNHLRLNLKLLVDSEQRVVDHVGMVAGNVGGASHWIEQFDVRVHNDLERLRIAKRYGTDCGEDRDGSKKKESHAVPQPM